MEKTKLIRFGTDGWRGIIAKDFTFENLGLVTQATGIWINEENISGTGAIIGYDTRFMGRDFAEHSATILATMGLPVRISNTVCTTPAVSWAALEYYAIGIMITASHNSHIYNGFKIKTTQGSSVSSAQIEEIEKCLGRIDPELVPDSFTDLTEKGLIREFKLSYHYLNYIRDKIDVARIKKSGIRIAHDSMYGSGQGLLKLLLGDKVWEIHAECNPGFPGIAPEPNFRSLTELAKIVTDKQCDIGIATDGDGERISMFDEQGNYVDPFLIMALLTKYLAKNKGLKGSVVKSFSTSELLGKQARRYGLMIETTPVGFNYIAERIVNEDVMIGGEESGGIAVAGHLPERDGIYIGLLMIDMIIQSGKPLSRLVLDLFDEFGPHHNRRNDTPLSDTGIKVVMTHFRDRSVKDIDGIKVLEWEIKDGVKMWLQDGTWILVRPSGTESIIRVYCESDSAEKSQHFADCVTDMVKAISVSVQAT